MVGQPLHLEQASGRLGVGALDQPGRAPALGLGHGGLDLVRLEEERERLAGDDPGGDDLEVGLGPVGDVAVVVREPGRDERALTGADPDRLRAELDLQVALDDVVDLVARMDVGRRTLDAGRDERGDDLTALPPEQHLALVAPLAAEVGGVPVDRSQ